MKTGVIVYVVGKRDAEAHFDEKQAIGNLGVTADRVEFIFSGQSEEDLAYSWWNMTCKGMARILCMAGEMIAPSNIRLFGHEMQLSAY